MALTIRDPETEALVTEISGLTGESKTATVRRALRAERERLADVDRSAASARAARVRRLLEEEVWPQLGADDTQVPLTKAEREAILGLGDAPG
jgi:antitoxin VapB